MVSIPSFILKKLYVKKSLHNTEHGFQLELKNILAEATINAPVKIYVDNKPENVTNIILVVNNKEIVSDTISNDNTIKFPVGVSIAINIKARPLTPAKHKIEIRTNTKEFGELAFTIQDSI